MVACPGDASNPDDCAKAVEQSRRVYLERTGTTFANGWRIFVDLNGNGTWDEGDLWVKLGKKDDQAVAGDWNGDGIDELSFAAAPGAASVTLQLLARGDDGRLTVTSALTRSGVVSGWVLK